MDPTMLLSWPKRRRLRDASGRTWVAVIEPGRLDLAPEDGAEIPLSVTDTDDLRAFAMQLHAAALEYDQAAYFGRLRGRAHLKYQRRRQAEEDRRRQTEEASA